MNYTPSLCRITSCVVLCSYDVRGERSDRSFSILPALSEEKLVEAVIAGAPHEASLHPIVHDGYRCPFNSIRNVSPSFRNTSECFAGNGLAALSRTEDDSYVLYLVYDLDKPLVLPAKETGMSHGVRPTCMTGEQQAKLAYSTHK